MLCKDEIYVKSLHFHYNTTTLKKLFKTVNCYVQQIVCSYMVFSKHLYLAWVFSGGSFYQIIIPIKIH